uniref:Uncharacterized protein n=1 Tax=Glossina pallidipes TaxID=7398 RepID=A0A1B0A4W1_GLOPL
MNSARSLILHTRFFKANILVLQHFSGVFRMFVRVSAEGNQEHIAHTEVKAAPGSSCVKRRLLKAFVM